MRADVIVKTWLRLFAKQHRMRGEFLFDVRRNYPGQGARGASMDIVYENVLGACRNTS